MKRTIHYLIEQNNLSIWDFLKEQHYPRSIFIQLKKKPNAVLLNQKPAFLYTKLYAKDELSITFTDDTSSVHIVGQDIPIDIIYEDEDLLIINKPPFCPIHPSQNHYLDSLANAVCGYYDKQQIPFVFRCINRLDKNTSGLTIIAKNMLSAAILSEEMKQRHISRTYLALVLGQVTGNGTIQAPIARKTDSTILRCVDDVNGKLAITHYQSLAFNSSFSLLQIHLEQGRTHQIRVHFSYINHPLLGDDLYGDSEANLQVSKQLNRQALHSYCLDFIHPITKKALHINAC